MATSINTIYTYEVECDQCRLALVEQFTSIEKAQQFADDHDREHASRLHMAKQLADRGPAGITGQKYAQPGEWRGITCIRANEQSYQYFVHNDWVFPVSDPDFRLCTWQELEAARGE